MKFGGTSLDGIERICAAAERVSAETARGHKVIVVVSAMAGQTSSLAQKAISVSRVFDAREYDAVVSCGENETAGLMALALQDLQIPARSWQGWQIPILTTAAHGAARIQSIPRNNLEAKFAEGMNVAVVAGFQGISREGRVTTLGRGGSDATAVALSAAFDAERCDIYTDVDGVYTADPRIAARAVKLSRISYEEMLELASLGARILQTRAVELAKLHGVRLCVRSSFSQDPGTLVCTEDEIMEANSFSGIAHSRDEAKITIISVADRPGVAASIFGPLAEAGINVDMIVQNVPASGRTDITFSCPVEQAEMAISALEASRGRGDADFLELASDDEVCKLSVVGTGMRSQSGIAARMFRALADHGINIMVISTSEIKISVLVDRQYLELGIRVLHDAFKLEENS